MLSFHTTIIGIFTDTRIRTSADVSGTNPAVCYTRLAMIRVKLYSLLAERSLSGKGAYEIPFQDGLRPLDIMRREGFRGDEEESIVVLVNEQQAGRRALLSDGDRVEFMINMAGG